VGAGRICAPSGPDRIGHAAAILASDRHHHGLFCVRVDLHCHSNASDGELAPADLLGLLAADGIALAAITDHDTFDGWAGVTPEAQAAAGCRLVPGIEFSSCYQNRECHIVGLGFDPAHPGMRAAVESQNRRRHERARQLAARLEWLGIPGALEGALAHADGAAPGRPHFARFLVESGRVRNVDEAFDRYLGEGKPAACPVIWPTIDEVSGWIRAAGGVAVLAHPLAYSFARTRSKLRSLVAAFRESGGAAVEVAMAGVATDRMAQLASLVMESGLRASAGSDFHSLSQHWRRPCRVPALPSGLEPVWTEWA
jgi:3',5'-nucleoside bisphosphate phosphatase